MHQFLQHEDGLTETYGMKPYRNPIVIIDWPVYPSISPKQFRSLVRKFWYFPESNFPHDLHYVNILSVIFFLAITLYRQENMIKYVKRPKSIINLCMLIYETSSLFVRVLMSLKNSPGTCDRNLKQLSAVDITSSTTLFNHKALSYFS